jgi:hypothetical protein
VQGSTIDGTWDSQGEAIPGRNQLTPFSTPLTSSTNDVGWAVAALLSVGNGWTTGPRIEVQAARCCKE